MPAEVKIVLSVDAQNAVQQVRDFAREAQQSIEKTYAGATEKAAAKINELAEKQKVLGGVISENAAKVNTLQQAMQGASNAEKQMVEQQIAALTKVNVEHQKEILLLEQKKSSLEAKGAAAAAETDAEKLAIQLVNQNRQIELKLIQDTERMINALKETAQRADTQRRTSLQELEREQRRLTDLIAAERPILTELQNRRAQAAGEQRRQLDQEAEGLRKRIDGWDIERLEIDKKTIAIQEEASVAAATSEAEIQQAQEEADANRNIVQTTIDISKAQTGVSQSVRDTESAVGNLWRQFAGAVGIATGIGLVVQAFRELKQVIVETRQNLEDAEAAAQRFRDLGASIFDKQKDAFTELGITDPADQAKATEVFKSIARETGSVAPSQVASTAASLAPTLKQQGIDITSDRGRDILKNASIMGQQGISGDNLRDFTSQYLQQNPQASGADLNVALGGVVAATGTPQMANNFLSSWASDKAIAEGVGMTMTDYEKLYAHLRSKGISPREIPELARQFVASSSRLRGLDIDQKVADADKLAEGGLGGLSQYILSTGNKPIDIQKVATLTAGMTPDQRDLVNRVFAGPRGVTALGAGAGWQSETLPTVGATGALQSNDAKRQMEAELAQMAASGREPTEEGATEWNEGAAREQDAQSRRPDLYTPTWKHTTAGDEKAWAFAGSQFRLLVKLAQLKQDVDSGKVTLTKEQSDSLDTQLEYVGKHLGDSDQLKALMYGHSGKATRAGALTNAAADEEKFFQDNITYRDYEVPSPRGDNSLEDILRAQRFENKIRRGVTPSEDDMFLGATPPPQPTTKPSGPTSVNYHIRQINYGYTQDEIGSPQSLPSFYG